MKIPSFITIGILEYLRNFQKDVTLPRLTVPDLIDDYDCDQMSRGETEKGGSDWKSHKHVINFDEPKPKETVKRSVLLVFESNH